MKARLIRMLRHVGDRLQVAGAPHGRYRAFHEAAHFLGDLVGDIEDLLADGSLYRILPLQPEVRHTIEDIVAHRPARVLGELAENPTELSSLKGVPLRYLELIRRKLGIRYRKDLEDALRTGELNGQPWLPKPIIARLERSLAPQTSQRRWTIGEALPIARRLMGGLRGLVEHDCLTLTGTLRRACEWAEGIYVLAASPAPLDLHEAFANLPGVEQVEATTKAVSRGQTTEGIPIELRTTPRECFALLQQFHTGSPHHTKQLRRLAKERGMNLRQDRLLRDGNRLPVSDEQALYQLLGLPLIPPELRRGRGEVDAARLGTLPNLLKPCHLAGDLHVHSDFSDGLSTVRQLAERAAELGYRYLAICDHSQSLVVARGLSIDRLRQKRRVIDRFNDGTSPVHVLCGAEVDILADGSLDYPPEALAELDVVIAAVHSNLRDPPQRFTKRILRAIAHPQVNVLAHATTRILGSRPAVDIDVDAILTSCQEHDVALEVNGHAHRLDPPVPIIERALELGVPLSLGSDAHHAAQLWMLELAVGQCRRCGARPQSVLNTFSWPELRQWLARSSSK